MGWTDPPTFTYDQLVDETDLNTYLRDNLDFLKSDPVIAQATKATATQTSNNQNVLVVSVGPTTIPSDIGACFVEVWSHFGLGMTSVPSTGHNLHGCYVSDGSTVVIDSRKYDNAHPPTTYYARSADLAWAGLSKTVTLYLDGYNYVTGAVGYIGPCTVRIVRSY